MAFVSLAGGIASLLIVAFAYWSVLTTPIEQHGDMYVVLFGAVFVGGLAAIVGIIAIVTGVLARRKPDQTPPNRTRAMVGIILATLAIVAAFGTVAAVGR